MGSDEFEKKRTRNKSGESTISGDSVSHYIPTPPDGGWGWMIVLASFLNHVIVDGIAFTFGVFYIEFLDYFKESRAKTALVGSLLCGFYLMTGPIAGALTNRFGCRAVCITGSFIAAGAFTLCTFCETLNTMMITYGVIGGFGLGLIYLPSIISVSYYFEKRRALATGIAVCGAGVGCFIFAPAGRQLLDMFDWKNAMLIVAALCLNATVCGMLMRPLEPPRKKRPRAKNVLDRLKERVQEAISKKQPEQSEQPEPPHCDADMLDKLRQVRLAREEALRDDDSLPGSVNNSVRFLNRVGSLTPSATNSLPVNRKDSRNYSRQSSLIDEGKSNTLPRIVVDSEVTQNNKGEKYPDVCQTEDEKAHMLPNEELQSDEKETKKNDKGKVPPSKVRITFSEDEPKVSQEKMNGVLNGHAGGDGSGNIKQNGTLNDGLLLQANMNGFKPTNRLLLPSDAKPMAVSDHNLWVHMVRKKAKMQLPQGAHKEDYARPMYRKDIFYSGSILHIPQFRSQPDVQQYVKSITCIPDDLPPEKETKLSRCLPKSFRDALSSMLDVSILQDPVFLIASMGNVFGMIGLYVPFVYIAQRAIALGVPETNAAFLLSVIGITNTAGRVLSGWLADFKCINPLLLHNIAIFLGGVACILNMFCNSYALMCAFAAFFGLCVATWISLTSIILCNLMGLEKLTNAFGLLTMMRGIASIAGPPIAGYVFDATNNYDASFHVGGSMLIVASMLMSLLHLPMFTKRGQDYAMKGDEEDWAPQLDIPTPPSSDDDEDDDDDDETENKKYERSHSTA